MYDICIIGAGIAGLYAAYNIKHLYPESNFIILEKTDRIGGRIGNYSWYGTELVIGAGIGRKKKDRLLYQLTKELKIKVNEFKVNPRHSEKLLSIGNFTEKTIKQYFKKTIKLLRDSYEEKHRGKTFKQYAKEILKSDYKKFILMAGYTDYENEDAYETLYHYGLEDNTCCWTGFGFQWQELIDRLVKFIGRERILLGCEICKIDTDKANQMNQTINGSVSNEMNQMEVNRANKPINKKNISSIIFIYING